MSELSHVLLTFSFSVIAPIALYVSIVVFYRIYKDRKDD